MQYNYSKIVVKSVEEFYQKLQEGYIFSKIELEESKKDDLYDYIQSQPDSVLKQFNLGNCYYYGYGVSKDYEKAVYWLKKSVNQDWPTALIGLGMCYLLGDGVPRNYDQALYLSKKAVDKGVERADEFFMQVKKYTELYPR